MSQIPDLSMRDRLREVSHSRPMRFTARAGLIATGIVHVLIGALAMSVANGFRGHADQSGALEAIADVPGGGILLWVATVSLIGLGLWQWTGSVTAGPDTAKVFPRKLRNRAKALGFTGVGLAALAFAVGGRPNSAEGTRTFSSTLINLPGGVFVLGAIGIVVGGVGVAYVVRGVSRRFIEDISPPDGFWGRVTISLGVVGYVSKGVALLMVGALFAGGALFTDSSWTTGLDGAVRYLAGLPGGPWPLFIVAGGLIVHGLYLATRGVHIRR